MAKPTDLAPWATDESNNTEPSSGQKATGWTVDQVPPSDYFNWWMFAVHMWIVWINALLTANGGVTALANQDITVSGTGRFAHGNKKLPIGTGGFQTCAPAASVAAGQVPVYGIGVIYFTATTGSSEREMTAAIPLPVGARIRSAKFWYKRGGGTLTFMIASTRDYSGSDSALMRLAQTEDTSGTSAETIEITDVNAWQAGTTYLVGELVYNSGNTYRCTTQGMSAGSGGPTGTGTGITDNATAWDYVRAGNTFEYTIAEGERPHLYFTAGHANTEFYGAQVTYDQPGS